MNPVAKMLIAAGVALIAAGLIWQLTTRMGLGLGKLPGDISIEKSGFRFYFPLTTCLLISASITLVMYLIRVLSRK